MNELLTVQEVAKILRVDVTSVRRWIKAGALKGVKLPSNGKKQSFRIRREDVDALFQ
jgi:excisionase family DNA binding protein